MTTPSSTTRSKKAPQGTPSKAPGSKALSGISWSPPGTWSVLASDSPVVNKDTLMLEDLDMDGGFSVWDDGDDMTLEMITDINESQVDEEVRKLLCIYLNLFDRDM